MIACGIDAGSRTMKVVLLDADTRQPVRALAADQQPRQAELASALYQRALGEAGLSRFEVAKTVATGYGRDLIVEADTAITEITCQARGVRSLLPAARTLVDIGGQDSKVIHLDAGGVRDFVLNDRCAAGTGRFLELVAQRLGLPLQDLGRAAGRASQPARITSMCAVFAETEIVSLLAQGAAVEDVAAGVLQAVADRVATLGSRGFAPPVVLTGGTALIAGMDQALARALGQELVLAPDPQLTAARGAALLACDWIRGTMLAADS